MKYTLYTTGNCQHCKDAKRYLNENQVEYSEVYLMTETDIANIKNQLPDAIRDAKVPLPVVFNENGDYIGDKLSMIQDHQARVKGLRTKSELFDMLSEHICEVVFTKLDGTERTMQCTLKGDYMPPASGAGLTERTPGNMNFMAVYDVENNGWRGFRIDKLKSIEIVGE